MPDEDEIEEEKPVYHKMNKQEDDNTDENQSESNENQDSA